MDGKDFYHHLKVIQKEVDELYKKKALMYAGQIASSLFRQNFLAGGFFGDEWATPFRRTGGSIDAHGKFVKNYAKGKRRTDRTLVDTGNLSRSIKYKLAGDGVDVYSDTPYGRYHNEGTNHLPRRQFIGDHPIVERAIIAEIERKLGDIFK